MNAETQKIDGKSQNSARYHGGLIVAAALCFAAVVWAYSPAIGEIVEAWGRDPDYSHGYLVGPIAAIFLWVRRDELVASRLGPNWLGAGILLLVAVLRLLAGEFYLGPVDAWTIPLSVAGVVLLIFGWQCLRWSLPSIVFLYFMIPIPYRAETWLSVPLQRVATKLSTESLQILGQPAIAEGNVIWLEDYPLEVAQACSGLRILVGILALAFAFVLFSNWAWWQKVIVMIAAIPVALVANAIRIVSTGLLYRLVSSDAAHQFSHDLAGFVMIPVAAGIFWLLLVYLDNLFPEVEVMSPGAVLSASGSQE